MPKLVGQDGTGWTFASYNNFISNGSAFAQRGGYVASASGSATLAHVRFGATASGTTFNVCVYVGSGTGATLLATSGVLTFSPNTDVTAGISCSIVGGQTYELVLSAVSLVCDISFNNGSSNFTCDDWNSTHFPNATPPASLPAPDANTGHEFVIWIEGTTGDTPMGQCLYTLP